MRKTFIALLLTAAVPVAAMAMPHGDSRPAQAGGPLKHLDISHEQKRQIHQLSVEQHKAQRKLTEDYLNKLPEGERKALAKDRQKARDDHQKALRKLLTPEQRKAFDEQQKKLQERKKEREAFLKWKAEQAK